MKLGKNGSGKSAILTGIVVALGERASATSRGQSIKGRQNQLPQKFISVCFWLMYSNIFLEFIKTGRNKAVVRITLSNMGQGCYQQDIYGDYITIERVINAAGGGGYRILNEQGIIMIIYFHFKC